MRGEKVLRSARDCTAQTLLVMLYTQLAAQKLGLLLGLTVSCTCWVAPTADAACGPKASPDL